MSERAIMVEVQVALVKAGARVFRNNNGVLQDRNGAFVRYGLGTGSSDLIGWTADGRFLAVEVKTPTGRISPEQAAFIEAVRKSGGIAFVARSAEEAIAMLSKETNEPRL